MNGNLPVRQQWTPERAAFVQSLLNEFPISETRDKLPSGFYIGMPIFMQDGRLLRISHSEEPERTGKEYGLSPGRISYWAGGEFSAVQGDLGSNKTSSRRILTAEGRRYATPGVAKRGAKTLTITGLDGSFDQGAFDSGSLRITGGPEETAGHTLLVGGNMQSVARVLKTGDFEVGKYHSEGDTAAIAAAATVYDITLHIATPLPFDLDNTADILVQGNPFGCQRFSAPGDASALDFPQFHTGTPTALVPSGHYYWNIVGGPAQGIAQEAISATECITSRIELHPYHVVTSDPTDEQNADMGKLKYEAYGDAAHHSEQGFARLITRSKTAFAADSFIPIWIYDK